MEKNVVIIGAGPAGVTAGYELLSRSKEYNVIILEESNDIGGISKTVNVNGNRMDMGGHRFFSKNDRVNAWWDKFMPKQGAPAYDDKVLNRSVSLVNGGPNPEVDDLVMLRRRRISRIYYRKKFIDYPISLTWKTIRSLSITEFFAVGFSYLKTIIKKRKENSLEDFYVNRFGKKLYSMFFEGYTEKLWGRHPREIAPDWGAQRSKGLSVGTIIFDIIKKKLGLKKNDGKNVETSLIEEYSYPKYGPGQLWEVVADKITKLNGDIRLNSRVVGIEQQNGKVTKVHYENQGKIYTLDADIVISSMPIKDLIASMNGVPSRIKALAEKLPYRDYVTVGILVKQLGLKNETKYSTLMDIVPDCWLYIQDSGVKLGRVQIYNNWSPYLVEKPEDTIWIGAEFFCTEGDEYWNKSKDEWSDLAVRELIKIGIILDESDVIMTHKVTVKKAYPAYFDSYAYIDEIISYLNEHENLYCVGRNGQHRYNNMDHSMVTSFETVDNILSGKKSKENIWNVNTEKVYHEEK